MGWFDEGLEMSFGALFMEYAIDDGGGAPAVVGMLLPGIDVVVYGPALTGVEALAGELVPPAAAAFCAAF